MFDPRFLSGFRTESYSIDLEGGFERAKERMAAVIHDRICADIGGDEQRVLSCHTAYDRITFKHLLLPIWISAYRFSSKVYRFLVNARTGEVQGERPYSWVKIALAGIGAAVVAALTTKTVAAEC